MSPHAHEVSFYDEDSELTDVVGRYVADGLLAGEPVVVMATAPHRESLDEFLTAQGIDPAGARRRLLPGARCSRDHGLLHARRSP